MLSSLNAGGIEKWLCDLTIENSVDRKLELVYCINSEQCSSDFFEDKIKEYGGRVIKIDAPSRGRFKYFGTLFRVMRREKFDVVHAHSFFFSGLVLAVAYFARVSRRVAHSHNNKNSVPKYRTVVGFLYATTMRLFLGIFSNKRLAVSPEAGRFLFGECGYDIVPCGVDFLLDGSNLGALELPVDKDKYLILAHVGSFTEQKNHEFMAEMARLIAAKGKGSNVLFLFIGDGPLRLQIEEEFLKANACAIFLGLRSDVKEILYKYADVFIFPSKYEGLGLVALEAQSQGLFCILSNNVPKSAVILDDVLTLDVGDDDPAKWVEVILSLDKKHIMMAKIDRAKRALDALGESPYTVKASLNALINVYNGIV